MTVDFPHPLSPTKAIVCQMRPQFLDITSITIKYNCTWKWSHENHWLFRTSQEALSIGWKIKKTLCFWLVHSLLLYSIMVHWTLTFGVDLFINKGSFCLLCARGMNSVMWGLWWGHWWSQHLIRHHGFKCPKLLVDDYYPSDLDPSLQNGHLSNQGQSWTAAERSNQGYFLLFHPFCMPPSGWPFSFNQG